MTTITGMGGNHLISEVMATGIHSSPRKYFMEEGATG